MGVQEIIKDGQEDVPTHDVFINDGASDDEDIPVAENIYSDDDDSEYYSYPMDDLQEDLQQDLQDALQQDLQEAIQQEIQEAIQQDMQNMQEAIWQDMEEYYQQDMEEYYQQDMEEYYLQEDLWQERDDLFAHEATVEFANSRDGGARIEGTRPIPAEPSTFADKPSPAPSKKFKNTVPRSRQGVGKKKARRIENARLLDQMRGDDDTDGCDINDFMPSDCTFRFTRILQDSDLTNKVLNPCVDFGLDYDFVVDSSIKARAKKSNENATSSKRKKLSAQAAFNNLYASEKDLFRRRNLPMGMVQYLDTCVLSFFEENPTGTYVSEPLSSFERLMLHSIAHFYELRSSSFYTENCSCRLTKVTNAFNYFDPPHLCLSKYVEQLAAQDNHSKSRKCKRFRRR